MKTLSFEKRFKNIQEIGLELYGYIIMNESKATWVDFYLEEYTPKEALKEMSK